MQRWVGVETIYAPENAARREAVHKYILENRLPAGVQWYPDLGARGANVRIAAIYIAEAMRRTFGMDLARAELILDTVALVASLLLLFAYLRGRFGDVYATLGLLFFASVLPLTYALHYYHPWDRLSLLAWIGLLLLLDSGRIGWFAVLLVLSISIKYDTVLLPGLYWLSQVTRENWRRTTVVTALMFSISFGTFALLRIIRPGGFDPLPLAPLLATTFEDFRSMWMAYPPALGFAIPLVLTAIGFSSAERFSRASAVFGVFLFVPFLVASNFAEFRAEVPILLLLLPCTLRGLQILLGEDLRAQRPLLSR